MTRQEFVTSLIVPNSYYKIESTKGSGYCRCYLNIIKQNDNRTWRCSFILIDGEITLVNENQECQVELLSRFMSAIEINAISKSDFNNKWIEAENIIKQIKKL